MKEECYFCGCEEVPLQSARPFNGMCCSDCFANEVIKRRFDREGNMVIGYCLENEMYEEAKAVAVIRQGMDSNLANRMVDDYITAQ